MSKFKRGDRVKVKDNFFTTYDIKDKFGTVIVEYKTDCLVKFDDFHDGGNGTMYDKDIDGTDLSGKNVKQVYPHWIVKEGDKYIPPKHKGLLVTEPEWEEKGLSSKAVRVVYPVMLTDGTVTYLSADRDSVKINLLAHVKQNMMNATFGICADRYKATEKQKSEIKDKKNEVLNALRACKTVDEMLECEIAKPFISGAWLDTPESMIQRKMCNNAIRKYPKNYDPNERLESSGSNMGAVKKQKFN